MSTIVVVAEQRDGELKKVTLEMIGKAKELGDEVHVALLGKDVAGMVSAMAGLDVAKVHVADDAVATLEQFLASLFDLFLEVLV